VACPGFLNGKGRGAACAKSGGSEEGVSPSPLREASREGAVSPRQKIFSIFL